MLRKLVAAVILLTAALANGTPGMAGDLPVLAFAGHYTGTGLARNNLSEYFNLTVRDLDVVITPRDEGFVLNWTTVLRQGGDPENPTVKRKSTSLTFVPTENENVFRTVRRSDPMSGESFAWARIRGRTLTVHSLVISEGGSYEIHTYDRTLGAGGMALKFTRVRDGETTRSVTGKLTKQSN